MIDTDASSSLTSVQLAVASLFMGKVAATMSVAQGNATMMTPLTWIGRCASREMTPRGRAYSFDYSTSGFVRADGSGSIAVDNLLDVVDGVLIDDADKPREGVITSAVTSSNGAVATLNTPSGPQQIKLLVEACKQAGIALTSVDAVECHADGQLLHDAVEIESVRKTYAAGLNEGGVEGRNAIVLMCSKPGLGNSIQANMNSLVKALFLQRIGMMAPNIHVRELNPYISYTDGDVEQEQPSHIITEHLALSDRQSMIATNGFGFGGTICCAMLSGEIDANKSPPPKEVETFQRLSFWPGGGGELEEGMTPSEGYDIVGSWTGFETPERMEAESNGVYGYTVTLGANRMEKFKVLLDGATEKVLHPGYSNPTEPGPVTGPDADASPWIIDGTYFKYTGPGAEDEPLALTGEELGGAPSKDYIGTTDGIGDKYRIKLQVAGKWRMMSWTKLESPSSSVADILKDPLVEGMYYITGDFNKWTFEAMEKGDNGTYTYDLALPERKGTTSSSTMLLVVRNKDWGQCFHPRGFFVDEGDEDEEVLGPDDYVMARSATWTAHGTSGKKLKVTFTRNLASGLDERKFSISK